jgi:enterochelin esterase-like enzyme
MSGATRRCLLIQAVLAVLWITPRRAEADNADAVEFVDVVSPSGVREKTAFSALSEQLKAPGTWRFEFSANDAVRIPHCNGRGAITVDGEVRDRGTRGPFTLARPTGEALLKPHLIRVAISVSSYEKRIACGEPIRIGEAAIRDTGTSDIRFSSSVSGKDAGTAVVFVPRNHDAQKPAALLVGLHPWNGDRWTYAAYKELLEEAQAKDVILLMPSGLGNSLYTANAEKEVLSAISNIETKFAIDPRRISIWGASMGGAGATTIAFHHPDRFAFVASYFGDSKYDLATYVRAILPTETAARRVNALSVVDNARHLPVWLIHGEQDQTSPIAQSSMLFDAMKQRGFSVDFDRVPGMGHEAPLVRMFLRRVVDRAAQACAVERPSRVSYRSVRKEDDAAYGVRIETRAGGDAFVDIERREDGIHVLPTTAGVRSIVLRDSALGGAKGDPTSNDTAFPIQIRWE